MIRYENQELGCGVLFFAACGWLIVDAVVSAPKAAPALWPLIPMFAAILWHVGLEHVRSRRGEPQ